MRRARSLYSRIIELRTFVVMKFSLFSFNGLLKPIDPWAVINALLSTLSYVLRHTLIGPLSVNMQIAVVKLDLLFWASPYQLTLFTELEVCWPF